MILSTIKKKSVFNYTAAPTHIMNEIEQERHHSRHKVVVCEMFWLYLLYGVGIMVDFLSTSRYLFKRSR